MFGFFQKRRLIIIIWLTAFLSLIFVSYKLLFSNGEFGVKAYPPDNETIRTTNEGRIIGFKENNNTYAWRGIPFAKPPVGKLRWRKPLAPEKWEGIKKTVKSACVCTQVGGRLGGVPKKLYEKPIGSEDCLYLNIWAPGSASGKNLHGEKLLPVMFWIHGGGNSIGHGSGYNGKTLAKKYNLIVVTINYRLGPFGWFTHPALIDENATPEDKSGNFGTLDIVQALKWVNRNIKNFGGNPDNVTVFGESAGGRNTLSMILSPQAKGLFHKAIVQSGTLGFVSKTSGQNFKDEENQGHRFSSKEIINNLLIDDKTCKNRVDAKKYQLQMSQKQVSKYLLNKSNFEILAAYKERFSGMLVMPNLFGDGLVLPSENPREIFKDKSKYNAVPVILGTNRDEFKLFMVQNTEFIQKKWFFFISALDKIFYNLYAGYKSDFWKLSMVDSIAPVLSKTQGDNVFAYRFDWDEAPEILGLEMNQLLGAAHGLEISFVFNDFDTGFHLKEIYSRKNLPGRLALSDNMSSYWAEFAYSGDPGKGRSGDQVKWGNWDIAAKEAKKMIIFDTPVDQGIRMSSFFISHDAFKQKLLDEKRFPGQEEHCRMYYELFGEKSSNHEKTGIWNDDEYENLGKEGCRVYSQAYFREKNL